MVHQIFACYLFDPENIWGDDDRHVICVHFVVFGVLDYFVEEPSKVKNSGPVEFRHSVQEVNYFVKLLLRTQTFWDVAELLVLVKGTKGFG